MISLSKFRKYKEILEKNIQKKSFRARFLFETLHDERFADEIINYIQVLKSNISAKELDEIFSKIRRSTIEEYEKSKVARGEIEQLNHCLRSLAYFYFLECMDEYSTISDGIIESIREKYKSNYLEIIARADQIYLSVDMKDKLNADSNYTIIDDDLILKYLVLKKWQDRQHYFFEGEYWNNIEKHHLNYIGKSNYTPFEIEQAVLIKRLFQQVTKDKLIDLETCSVLSELYIKGDVVNLIGGKMYGLAVLNSNGIPVPYSVVIPTCSQIDEEDLKFLKEKFYSYSVRSSADIEDGMKNSFAGMFDSFLNIKPEFLLQYVNKVRESINNDRVAEYIKLNKLNKPHMAVIIQSFKEPSYAGVWIGNSESSGILEFVEGNGEKLVSGQNTPHTEFWNSDNVPKNALEINGVPIGKKMLEYQQLIGCNADFEWMILDGNLVMLQYRPVTKNISNAKIIEKKEENIYGTAAAPGIASGHARYLEHPEEMLYEGEILLTKITGTSWVPNLMKSKGAVTARGGILCHTAIICRELGIPCVTGVGDEALQKLAKTNNILINGSTGEVVIEK